ncbi:MAG: glycosyltransferase family 9 protein [Candidatus Eremiobacteraeota bacterium]|nr:glycosyltransferase family 9 protein [Candidatus Eremiobacteraeota bacterium]
MRALVISAGGGVGDTFLASIVARALREGYATVDMLVLPSHRTILRGNPDISGVLEESDPAVLRKARYDAAVCTWATLENALLPLRAGIRIRVGQSRRLYSFLFNERVRVRSELGDRQTHWTQILLDYARALGCDVDDTQPRVALDESDRAEADRILAAAGSEGAPFAILHPTRGIDRPGRWPVEPFARLANALVARYELPLFVTGSPQDRPFVDRVFAEARKPAINIAGTTSLRSFTALAERARFVVAMDSGPMHLAASTGTPTVGIFALRSDEPSRWAPLGARTAVVRGTYPCPPNHRKETCPDFACVCALEFAPIFEAVDRLTR